jgi:hypothetical protein
MRLISSRSTWVYKRLFPAIWFGLIGLMLLVFLCRVSFDPSVGFGIFICLVMMGFGYALMEWLIFPMVDGVWIDGDDLVVRNRGEEDRFPIRHVVDVDHRWVVSPERVELLVNPRSRFGPVIQFIPTDRWFPFGRHPLVQELIDRSGCRERRADARE